MFSTLGKRPGFRNSGAAEAGRRRPAERKAKLALACAEPGAGESGDPGEPLAGSARGGPVDGRANAQIRTLLQRLARQEPDVGAHSDRLALMACILGVGIGLNEGEIRRLRYGAYLHDVGKTGIGPDLLRKRGPLTEAEWTAMRRHPLLGEAMCREVPGLEGTLPIIRWHHERWDGSGYPDRLRGEQIPLLARITQIIDIYDALTSERPYRRPDTPQGALRTIQEESARGWRDPELVAQFERLFPLFAAPPDTAVSTYSLVMLSEAVRRGQWG